MVGSAWKGWTVTFYSVTKLSETPAAVQLYVGYKGILMTIDRSRSDPRRHGRRFRRRVMPTARVQMPIIRIELPAAKPSSTASTTAIPFREYAVALHATR